jgi:hypothetical protein
MTLVERPAPQAAINAGGSAIASVKPEGVEEDAMRLDLAA